MFYGSPALVKWVQVLRPAKHYRNKNFIIILMAYLVWLYLLSKLSLSSDLSLCF